MKKLVMTLVFMLVLVMVPILALAEDSDQKDSPYTAEEILEVRNILRQEDVPEEKIDGLVYKLEHGIPWDSFNVKYRHLKPQIKRDGYEKTIYPDGSYVVEEITFIEEVEETFSQNVGV